MVYVNKTYPNWFAGVVEMLQIKLTKKLKN